MAERFGASFTMNINDLKAGLKTANALIKESKSEFEKAAAGISGDWQKSEEGVSAKIKSLNSIIDVQETKVKALADQYRRELANGMEESSDRAIRLRTQLNNEQTALEKTKKELDEQTKAYDNLKNSSDEAGNEIEDTGKQAEKTANGGFSVLKGAMAGLVRDGFNAAIKGAKDLANQLVNVGQKADDLNTLSQQSGFSIEELQKFEYASELIDVNVDTIISSAKRLKKNMTSNSKETAETWEKLGITITDEAGNIRNSNDVFYEVIEALKNVDNETERDIAAMQLFGRNADELAGLIDDGGEALRRYGEEAEDLGIIMSQDAVDSANEFNDAIDKIKATGQGVFNTIGAEIAKELVPEVESVREQLNKFIKSKDFKDFKKKAVDTIKNFVKIGKEIAKTVLPTIAKAVKFVADNFDKLVPAVYTAVTIFAAFKAALAISSTITAFKAATLAAKAATDAATASQAGWNAVMAANPIGAVLTAVGLLAAGIGLLVASNKDAEDSTKAMFDELDERYPDLQDHIDKVDEMTKSYDDMRDAQQKILDEKQSEMDYYNQLWKELQNITDENGKVKEGYEKRAEYITSQLSDALDVEITMTDGVIKGYQQLRDEIDKLMKKKKAEIFLEVQEERYKEALDKKNEAFALELELQEEYNDLLDEQSKKEKELADKKDALAQAEKDYAENVKGAWTESNIKYVNALKDAQDAVSELETYLEDSTDGLNAKVEAAKQAYEEQAHLTEQYVNDIGTYEHNLEAIYSENYDAIIEDTYTYNGKYEDAADKHKKALEDQIEVEKLELAKLNKAAEDAGDERYKTEIAAAEARLQATKDELAQYNKTTEDELNKKNLYIWERHSSEVLSKITNKKVEFRDVGNGLVQSFVDGEKLGKALPAEQMKIIVDTAINEAKNQQGNAENAGLNIIEGLTKGVKNESKQKSLFSTVRTLGENVLKTLKLALDEHSPSATAAEYGALLVKGLEFGVSAETPALFKQVETLGEGVLRKIHDTFKTKTVADIESRVLTQAAKDRAPYLYETAAKVVEETVAETIPAVLYSGAKRVKTNGANKPLTISVYPSSSTSSASSAVSSAASALSAEKTVLAESKVTSVITEIKAILSDIRANISEIKLDIYDSTNQSRAIRSQYRTLDERAAQLDKSNKNITVQQYNTFSQAHSRYELYKAKQQTYAAVRLANVTS